MKNKRGKFSIILLLFAALIFSYARAAAEEERNLERGATIGQNFHRWGAVTIFNGLSSDKVRAITQTLDGVLWFGTESGLSKFDGRRIQPIVLNNGRTDRILTLKVSADGVLWIGTGDGLFRYRNGRFRKVEETSGKTINSILLGESLFLATADGQILRLNQTADDNFRVETIPAQKIFDSDNVPLSFTALAQIGGKTLAGSRGRSVLIIENDQTFETFSRPRPFFVNALMTGKNRNLWLGADADERASGLYSINDISRPQRIGEALGNVLSIEADEAGGIWVGTESRGLFHFDAEMRERGHYTFENTAGGLRSNTVYALFVDREGVVWAGTDRGACRFDSGSPLVGALSETSGNSNFIRVLFKASDGKIYAGTNRGLFLLSGESWSELKSFAGQAVYAVSEDTEKQLLIGTSGGLFTLDRKQKTSGDIRATVNFHGKNYAAVFGGGILQIDTQTQILSGNAAMALAADDKNLWIGTATGEVFVFDGREIRQPVPLVDLRGGAIRKIAKDAAGNLWLAGDKGLFIFAGGRLENIIAGKIVQDVIVDGDNVWAGTNGGGLVHVRRDETFGWLIAELNIEQGLPSPKIFSVLKSEDHLLFGTNRGMVSYLPNTMPPKIIPARILSQRLYEAEELAQQPITLDYPQNSLVLEVSGLSSRTYPEQFQYGFVLKNSRGEILDKKLSGDAQYAPENLPAGEYSIEARAYSNDLLSSEPLIIRFSVAPAPFPWTATALAALLAVALIGLFWAIVERRRIGERNRQLAAVRFDLANEAERERKRLAGDLHDQTLADLRNLMLMSDRLPANNSEFRREVESISTEIRRICEDLSPSVLENVGLVAALEFLLKQTAENGRFITFVGESGDAGEDNFEEKLKFSANEQMQIYRIAQEVLTNIKHHANAASVEMRIIAENEKFVLTIEDDGTPFAPTAQFQTKGRGIGNIKSRAALINAVVSWRESERAGGTIFELRF